MLIPRQVFVFAEAVRMLNLAIGMFEDIGRLSMAAKHYKVLLRLCNKAYRRFVMP
jgi:hypothetical protein